MDHSRQARPRMLLDRSVEDRREGERLCRPLKRMIAESHTAWGEWWPNHAPGSTRAASSSTAPKAKAELMASRRQPAVPAQQPMPAVETKARTARWSERVDGWFFGELASLCR